MEFFVFFYNVKMTFFLLRAIVPILDGGAGKLRGFSLWKFRIT